MAISNAKLIYLSVALIESTILLHNSLLSVQGNTFCRFLPKVSAFRHHNKFTRVFSRERLQPNCRSSKAAHTCDIKRNQDSVRLFGTMVAMVEPPPIPRREEDRVVYAGVAPEGWDMEMPRQADESTEELMDPPVPVKDPYGWLRDDERKNKEVLQHLEAENEYSQKMTKHLKGLQDKLYQEFLSSIQETDYTTPRPRGDYWYYSRTFEGKSYRQFCRAPKTSDNYGTINWDGSHDSIILPGEEVYLDVNVLGKDKSYCSVEAAIPSPSQKLIAYSVDYSGDEKYEMHVLNLETGEDLALKDTNEGTGEELLETTGEFVWGNDDSILYFTTFDDQHRPYRLHQRRDWSGENPIDTLMKEEPDDLYEVDLSKSLDGNFIFLDISSSETSEVWFLPTAEEKTTTEMKCIAPRRNKVLYEVDHGHDSWWIWTNVDESPNMKLMKAPAQPDCASDWKLVEDANENVVFDGSLSKALDSVTVFGSHVVVEGREGGIPRVWIYSIGTKSVKRLEFEEAAHDVGLGAHYEFETKSLAVVYDSLLTPSQTLEISLENPDDTERTILKSKVVPNYQKELYGCDRLEVLSRDGETQIPISVVYRKSTMDRVKNGERVPVHLYGYGSYGSCCEADFDSTRLPFLERGMIYVIAHVRGGGEMGRQVRFFCNCNNRHLKNQMLFECWIKLTDLHQLFSFTRNCEVVRGTKRS